MKSNISSTKPIFRLLNGSKFSGSKQAFVLSFGDNEYRRSYNRYFFMADYK